MVVLNITNITKYGKDIKLLTDLCNIIYKKHQIKHIEIIECVDKSVLDNTTKYVMIEAYYNFYKYFTKHKSSVLTTYMDSIVNNSIMIPLIEQKKYETYTYEELEEILNSLFGMDYMLLYLFLKMGVRNSDIITTLNDNHDNSRNYFIFDNDVLFFIRNNYKNCKKYGQLVHKIDDEKFKQYIKDTPINSFVFVNNSNKPYNEITIALRLKRILQINGERLFNKKCIMSQSTLFEIVENKYRDNTEELIKLYSQRPQFDKLIRLKTT
jgi:hypothetical protein